MRRREASPILASIALHVIIGVVLLRVLMLPLPLDSVFKHHPPPVERIGFIALPKGPTNTAGQSGGNGRPETAERAPVRLAAPTVTPPSIPAVPRAATPLPEDAGTGPIVGTPGPARGVRPSYTDPRVWVTPGAVVTAPKPPVERADSVLRARLQAHNDSLEALAGGPRRDPGDWTFEKGGQKYGVDRTWIHLGKVQIPTALLALLPLNAQGNPTAMQRNRQLTMMHNEIAEQAQRSMNEDEFRKAVKAIRERKERERSQQQNQQLAKDGAPPPSGNSAP